MLSPFYKWGSGRPRNLPKVTQWTAAPEFTGDLRSKERRPGLGRQTVTLGVSETWGKTELCNFGVSTGGTVPIFPAWGLPSPQPAGRHHLSCVEPRNQSLSYSTSFTFSMPACGNLTVLQLTRLSFGSSHAQIQLPQLLTPKTYRRAVNGSDHYIYYIYLKPHKKCGLNRRHTWRTGKSTLFTGEMKC